MATRREFLLSTGGAAIAGAQSEPRPNIVFVLMDDVRWDDIGIMGHPWVRTPHIDRIAREGVLFRNAFATTPLCSPSRANFFTGQYAYKHGIIDNVDRSPLTHRLMTFPRILHEAGYETGFVGKWHMGIDDSPRPGFDYWVSIQGQGYYFDPEINENGKVAKVPGYATDIFTDRAVGFLRKSRNKPFVLCVSHKAVHPNVFQNADGSVKGDIGGAENFTPAPRHTGLYKTEKIPLRPNAGRKPEGKPALLRKIGDLPPLGADTVTSEATIRNRLRMLAAADEGIGRIRAALEETGQLDNTVFVFTSDHGYFYGEHGLDRERRLAYEETIRIPLFIRYPRKIRAGMTEDRFALSIDLAPTLLELGGVKVPASMHGRSLLPLIEGRAKDWRDSFLIEYYSDTVMPRIVKMGYQAVRTKRWKYIRYKELQGMDELYDLESDPYEMRNRIDDTAAQKQKAALQAELNRLLVG